MRDIDDIRRDNLKIIEAEAGGATAAANQLVMSVPQFSNLRDGAKDSKTGKPRGMRKDTARKIEKAAGKPKGWLDVDHSLTNFMPAAIGMHRVPCINYVQAGRWTEIADNFTPDEDTEWLLTDRKFSGDPFALEIEGDSMLPDFKPGDRVIIDPAIAPVPGDFVVASTNEDKEATFKKYRLLGIDANGNDIIELVPLNQDFPSLRSDTLPITIIGTMVEHRRYRRK